MKTVLIANRGEIALRVVRACRDYGVGSVAIFADADADAPYVREADRAFSLPGSRPAETYLNIPAILEIAQRAGADAVHPGYGFLSESAEFAQAVLAAGLAWVGPPPAVIAELGDKVAARRIAMKVGAPLVPGTPGPVDGPEDVLAFVRAHGLPIAIKASHGGGGRGMRVAREMAEIEELYHAARREAETAFGNGACYVERFLDRPRHVEAQVIADRLGNVVVLGTRDCSLQRRNQKLIEEAPAPFLSEVQRDTIHDAARRICTEAGYEGAGTVEFLLGADGMISFLEVNTRLQVEHPVTEETTGVDLVVEQLRIADGLPLSVTQTPRPNGHAIEFRINAEDPGRGFLPTPGGISMFHAPSGPGVRVDSGVESGSTVPGTFDSMMAKLVVWGPDRKTALSRARRALREFRIEGVASVLPFHRAALEAEDFTQETGFAVHTRWIETDFAEPLEAALRVPPESAPAVLRGRIEIDGALCDVGFGADLVAKLTRYLGTIPAEGAARAAEASVRCADEGPAEGAGYGVAAPISGLLLDWTVGEGETVRAGQTVAMMEAMKMETPVVVQKDGVIHLQAAKGASLAAGQIVAEIA
ncbi:biotin carboxylase N-terminal domain-containing protein (plasmid) [Thioclava litoralis]|uniref:Biotin carboxylase N-terminal domain-containing protein n=1 Tax=Thioclava litoralis TaxID=3076557 RepID=A0ABZ1E669_9RHOB|nr:biotin carboxylase N-terminal domain-containing protein [Thioclava sp. FTW29]